MGGRTAEPASRGEGAAGGPTEAAAGGGDGVDVSLVRWMLSMTPRPVSYTHLTLPTSDLV